MIARISMGSYNTNAFQRELLFQISLVIRSFIATCFAFVQAKDSWMSAMELRLRTKCGNMKCLMVARGKKKSEFKESWINERQKKEIVILTSNVIAGTLTNYQK